jgi:hypothetical protein
VRSNPTARHYHQVAARRADAQRLRDGQQLLEAVGREGDPFRAVQRVVEEREREEFGDDGDDGDGGDGGVDGVDGVDDLFGVAGVGVGAAGVGRRVRPLEDPGLVGEVAAKRNREERLRLGNDILVREDKRWDWLLSMYSASLFFSLSLFLGIPNPLILPRTDSAGDRPDERLGRARQILEALPPGCGTGAQDEISAEVGFRERVEGPRFWFALYQWRRVLTRSANATSSIVVDGRGVLHLVEMMRWNVAWLWL